MAGYVTERNRRKIIGGASGPAAVGALPSIARVHAARPPVAPARSTSVKRFVGNRTDVYTGAPGDGADGWTRTWGFTQGASGSGDQVVPSRPGLYSVTTQFEIQFGPADESIRVDGVGPPWRTDQPGGGFRTIHLTSDGYGIDTVPWWGTLFSPDGGIVASASADFAITGMRVDIIVSGYLVPGQ